MSFELLRADPERSKVLLSQNTSKGSIKMRFNGCMTWTVKCSYTEKLTHKAATCCVSFSAFFT
uniref:Uncharacterized protein n=1 Tax=Physcomitrium patens TaxID=3218 RepID=A0A2K1JDL9_PHYPA|nr:hypothetical protein PHYPA_019904 [Physcomitrium patens]